MNVFGIININNDKDEIKYLLQVSDYDKKMGYVRRLFSIHIYAEQFYFALSEYTTIAVWKIYSHKNTPIGTMFQYTLRDWG
jgi:hypothetical protein